MTNSIIHNRILYKDFIIKFWCYSSVLMLTGCSSSILISDMKSVEQYNNRAKSLGGDKKVNVPETIRNYSVSKNETEAIKVKKEKEIIESYYPGRGVNINPHSLISGYSNIDRLKIEKGVSLGKFAGKKIEGLPQSTYSFPSQIKDSNDEMIKKIQLENQKYGKEIQALEAGKDAIIKKFAQNNLELNKKVGVSMGIEKYNHEINKRNISAINTKKLREIDTKLQQLDVEKKKLTENFAKQEKAIKEEQQKTELRIRETMIREKQQQEQTIRDQEAYRKNQYYKQKQEAKEFQLQQIKKLSLKEKIDEIIANQDPSYVETIVSCITEDPRIVWSTTEAATKKVLDEILINLGGIIPKFYTYNLEKLEFTVDKVNKKMRDDFRKFIKLHIESSVNPTIKVESSILECIKRLHLALSSNDIIKSDLERYLYKTLHRAYKGVILANKAFCVDKIVRNINYKDIMTVDMRTLGKITKESIKNCNNPDELNEVSTMLYLKLRLETEINSMGLEWEDLI